MQLNKVLAMAAVAVMVVPFGIGVGSAEQNVQASSTYTLKTFPKKIRGTWYMKNGHKYDRIHISSKSMTDTGYTYSLKQRKRRSAPRGKHLTWVIANNYTYKGQAWTNVMGYSQGAGDGAYYGRTSHILGGHKRAMLHLASGAMIWTDGYAFHTKHLAKLYSHKHFSGDRNRSSF